MGPLRELRYKNGLVYVDTYRDDEDSSYIKVLEVCTKVPYSYIINVEDYGGKLEPYYLEISNNKEGFLDVLDWYFEEYTAVLLITDTTLNNVNLTLGIN